MWQRKSPLSLLHNAGSDTQQHTDKQTAWQQRNLFALPAGARRDAGARGGGATTNFRLINCSCQQVKTAVGGRLAGLFPLRRLLPLGSPTAPRASVHRLWCVLRASDDATEAEASFALVRADGKAVATLSRVRQH